MTTKASVSPRRQRDEGASLILVLLFVAVVGMVLAALLPYTRTGIREAANARDVRSVQNAVDGAVQGAIGQVRLNPDACVGANTPTYAAPAYPDPVGSGSTSVTVTCSAASSGDSNDATVPPYAIVTTGLGTTSNNGNLILDGNTTLAISGGVYTNGDITTTSGNHPSLVADVTGAVYSTAGHSCSSTLVYASAFPDGVPHCPRSASDPSLPTLSYVSALGSSPSVPTTVDPVGTCASNSSIVTFVPGYYSEAPQPDPVTCKNNPGSVWWFSPCSSYSAATGCAGNSPPGAYYFDFPDSTYANYSDSSATLDLDAAKVSVIGGSLANGWSASTSASAVTGADAGTRCTTKSTSTFNATGVQIVLGGPSAITTGNNSEIELCASATAPSASAVSGYAQRIALYGLDQTPGTRSDSHPGSSATAVSDVSGETAFSASTLATGDPDNLPAVATFVGNKTTYGVTLSGFSTPTAGSLVTAASLDVTHSETDTALSPYLTVTYGSGATALTDTCNLTPTGSAAYTTTSVNLLSSCKFNYLKSLTLRYSQLQGMTVQYHVAASNNTGSPLMPALGNLDAVKLTTTAVAPAIDGVRCAKTATATCFAYTNSTNTSGNNTFFRGTVYLPTGALYALVHNSPNTIFSRGVVAGSLSIKANSSSKQTDAPFQLPHSPTTSRSVLFTATTGGRTRLRALVKFVDYTVSDPSSPDLDNAAEFFPGRQVIVQEWTNLP